MSPPRFVIDTNTLVSSILIANSIPDQAFQWIRQSGTILASQETIIELESVLIRPKFDKYITKSTRLKFIEKFIINAEIISIEKRMNLCRDPKDDKFLDLAINGMADYLITGDRDLLILHPLQNLHIITPAQLLSN